MLHSEQHHSDYAQRFLLVVAPKEEEAFWMFAQILTKYEISSFFREGMPLLQLHLSLHAKLLDAHFPKLKAHLENHEVLHFLVLSYVSPTNAEQQ